MKTTLLINRRLAFLAAFSVATLIRGQSLFLENFDADHSANWTVNASAGTHPVNLFFDYSTIGIPSAPNSGGTTRGAKLQANTAGGVFGGVSISPTGQGFTGNYRLRFDLWLNYNGPLNGGGNGPTQLGGAGIGTAGITPQWSGGTYDCVFFSATGDGGSTSDYRAYSVIANNYAPTSGVYSAGTSTSPDARNNSHTYYASYAPFSGKTAPAAQVSLYPQQSGTTAAGALGFAWRDVVITRTNNKVNWTIDGRSIATVDTSSFSISTNILLNYYDINATTSTDPNAGALLFALFDNVRVEGLPNSYTMTGGGTSCQGDGGVTVGLSGSETGVDYLLRTNGIYCGVTVAGTGSAISFGNQTNAGTYSVLASNTTTTLTHPMTGNTIVTVSVPTAITSGPTPAVLTNYEGGYLRFSITAAGTGLTYQWQKDGINLTNGGRISGATSSMLQFHPAAPSDTAEAGHGYTCLVSNGCGVLTSSEATATVIPFVAVPEPIIGVWTNRLAVPNGVNESVSAVLTDDDGNIIVTGYTEGTVPDENFRVTAIKYSSAGLPVWTNNNNGALEDREWRPITALDPSGNLIVAKGYDQIVVSKYSGIDGLLLWEHRAPDETYPSGLAVDRNGDVFVTALVPNSRTNYTAKYSGANGSVIWEKRLSLATPTDTRAIALDPDGNAVIAGSGLASGESEDKVFVVKFAASDGTVLWETRRLGKRVGAVVVGPSGNVVVAAHYRYSSQNDILLLKLAAADGALLWEVQQNVGPGVTVETVNGCALDASENVVITGGSGGDFYTAKYAAAHGTLLWDQRYNGASIDLGEAGAAVVVDANGDVVVTGSSGINFFDPIYPPTSDIYTAKYAGENGAVLWSARFNGAANRDDMVALKQGLAITSGGDIVIGGATDGVFMSDLPVPFSWLTIKYGSSGSNTRPALANPIPDRNGLYGTPFSFTFAANTFSDPDAGQTLSYSASGLPAGITFTPATRTFSGTPTALGTSSVTVTATDNGSPPLSTNDVFDIVIGKAPLTATADNKSRTYAEPNPSLTFGYSGFVLGEDAAVLDTPPVAGTTATNGSPVGPYPITLGGGADDHYEFNYVSGTLTITPSPLTVTVDSTNRAYGAINPVFTGSIAGLVNGDNITAAFSTIADTNSPPGTYPIMLSLTDPDNKLGNYTVTTNAGTLTVHQPPSLVIAPALLDIVPGGLTSFQATGGQPPYRFTIATNNSGGSINTNTGAYAAGSVCGTSDTIQVTDSAQATAWALVQIDDAIPPTITCPNSLNVQCLADVPAPPATLAQFRASGGEASDNSGTNLVYRCSDTIESSNACTRVIHRTHAVTDACTNSASCTQIITVLGSPLTVACPTNLMVDCTNAWAFVPPTVTDGCCGTNVTVEVVSTETNGPCPQTITRTWRITDCCTNQMSCSQTVTLIDTTPPILTCASNKTVECGAAQLTVLHHFAGVPDDGIYPQGPLVWSRDGAIYGATGGAIAAFGNSGVIFRINPDGTGYSILHRFEGGDENFSGIHNLIEGSDGVLYGTTPFFGDPGLGTLFRMNRDGTGFLFLHHFVGGLNDGEYPGAGVIEASDGALYGTTVNGGTGNGGMIYRINRDGTGFQILHHLAAESSGARDVTAPLLEGRDGALYGTSTRGGSSDGGTVFRVNRDGTGFQILHHFTGSPDDGALPGSGLIQGSSGALFGTTYEGGANGGAGRGGVVFTLNPDGTDYRILHHFTVDPDDGSAPSAGLTEGNDGTLYGTTSLGKWSDTFRPFGSIFRINQDGSDYAVLWRFTSESEGINPTDPLIEGPDGALYGLTGTGGEHGLGILFRFDRTAGAAGRSFDAPAASDACCGTNVTISVLSTVTNGSCPQKITRTWLAADCCGNSNTCSQTITVVDTTPPVVTCPSNLVVQCLAEVPPCPTNLAGFLALGGVVQDACSTNLSYSCSDAPLTNGLCGGSFVRTHTVTDDCTNSASCTQIITVLGSPLLVTCPTNRTEVCGAAWSFDLPITAGACCGSNVIIVELDTVTNGSCPQTITRTWRITDCCTNSFTCNQTVTLVDPLQPVITMCAAGRTNLVETNCQAAVPDLAGEVVVADASGSLLVLQSPPPGTLLGVGDHWIIFTATNAAGRSVTCAALFKIIELVPPTLQCPTNLLVEVTRTNGAVVHFAVGADDDCTKPPMVECAPPSGSIFPLGTTTVACAATDASSNRASCSFTVTVRDTTPPIVRCLQDQNRVTDANLQFVVPDFRSLVAAADESGPATLEQTLPPGTVVGPGAYPMRITATDVFSNATHCPFTLTVFSAGVFEADTVPICRGDRLMISLMQLGPSEQPEDVECWVLYSTQQVAVANATLGSVIAKGRARLGAMDGNRVVEGRFIFPHTDHPRPNLEDVKPVNLGSGRTVFYKLIKKTSATTTASDVRQFVMPYKITIGLFGDSFAAGEGAPEIIGPVALGNRWTSEIQHRSKYGGFALAVAELKRTTPETAFLSKNVTCSGASLKRGLYGSYQAGNCQLDEDDPAREEIPPQIKQIDDWLRSRNYVLDGRPSLNIAVMSGGGNDINFGELVKRFFLNLPELRVLPPYASTDITEEEPVAGQNLTDADEIRDRVRRDIDEKIPGRYQKLRDELDAAFNYDCVLVTEYPTMLQRQTPNGFTFCGGDDCCWPVICQPSDCWGGCWGPLERLNSVREVEWAQHNLLDRLNASIRDTVGGFENWRFLDGISALFRAHGICNCDDPWFNTFGASWVLQGDACGTMHPNHAGYANGYRPVVLAGLRDAVAKLRLDCDDARARLIVDERLRRRQRANEGQSPVSPADFPPALATVSWDTLLATDNGRAALAHAQNLVLPPPQLPPLPPAFDTDYDDLEHAVALGVQPRTEIAAGGGGLIITWPEWASEMVIESSPSLGPDADWQPLTAPTESQNGVRSVRITPDGGGLFIRLRLP